MLQGLRYQVVEKKELLRTHKVDRIYALLQNGPPPECPSSKRLPSTTQAIKPLSQVVSQSAVKISTYAQSKGQIHNRRARMNALEQLRIKAPQRDLAGALDRLKTFCKVQQLREFADRISRRWKKSIVHGSTASLKAISLKPRLDKLAGKMASLYKSNVRYGFTKVLSTTNINAGRNMDLLALRMEGILRDGMLRRSFAAIGDYSTQQRLTRSTTVTLKKNFDKLRLHNHQCKIYKALFINAIRRSAFKSILTVSNHKSSRRGLTKLLSVLGSACGRILYQSIKDCSRISVLPEKSKRQRSDMTLMDRNLMTPGTMDSDRYY